MDEQVLEKTYQENLSERIIAELAKRRNVPFEQAMNLYYNSHLADMIQRGEFDIQYLDYKVLTQMLCEEYLAK